jgi:GNAT superfamily N-acetyltransferase
MSAFSELVILPRREIEPSLYVQTAELILEIGNYKHTRDVDQVMDEMSARTTLVALDETQRVVGTSALRNTPCMTLLEDVISHPDHRGDGIGIGVVKAAEDLARNLGVAVMYLAPSKQALGFYTSRHLKYQPFGDHFLRKFLI